MNKRKICIGAIIILVIILVAGTLNGWFRKKEHLSTDQATALAALVPVANIDAAGAEFQFNKLWLDHVSLTRAVILSQFNDGVSLEADVATLLQNQKDIAQAVNQYYPGSYQIIADLLTDHIVIAKDILDDLKLFRLARLPKDINKWYANADLFSEAMQEINSKWDMYTHMHTHLWITEKEAIYEWLGFEKHSVKIYENKIAPQSQDIAYMIVSGL